MKSVKMSFKNRVLIPAITIFTISVFLIAANDFRLLDMSIKTKTNSILDIFTSDILNQINQLDMILETTKETLNKQNMAITRAVAQILDQEGVDMSTEALKRLCEPLGIIELTVADSNGVVIYSNFDEYIGFNYNSTEPTRKYMDLADGTINELTEEPRKSEVEMSTVGDLGHYTGISRKNGGFLQIGYDAGILLRLQDEINIAKVIKETKIGENSYGIVVNNGIITAHPNDALLGYDISSNELYKTISTSDGFSWIYINEVRYYAGYKNINGRIVIGLVPETDYYREIRNIFFNTLIFFSVSLFIMIFAIYKIINRQLKPITKVTEGIKEIAKGNFDARIEGNYTDEFSLIKNAVNDMAKNISSYLNDKLKAERLVHEAELQKLDLMLKVNYDGLTGVYNRRYLDENLEHIIKTLSRSRGTISILMVDIDYFKLFNDTYGHSEGDECLKIIAKNLNENVTRENDFVTRYGGEEFCIVLPNTDENGARQIADKMLNVIRALKIKNEKSLAAEFVTISIGVTTGIVTHVQKNEDYIKRADEALYMSKQNGRDRSTFLPI